VRSSEISVDIVRPSYGPLAGGTRVTINGQFIGVPIVKFVYIGQNNIYPHANRLYLAVFCTSFYVTSAPSVLKILPQASTKNNVLTEMLLFCYKQNKKAVLPQGNRAMPQVFFSVEVRQQHSLQV